jgi:hypothetical protein
MFTETITQREAIAAGVPPQQLTSSRASTGGVDMQKSRRAFFVLYVGAVVSGSISAWLQESSDNFNTDVPTNDAASSFSNSGGTNLSLTGLQTSNRQYTFEVNQSQLTTGKRYVRLQVKETAGNATYVSVVAYGDEGQEKPNNKNNDPTTVLTQNVVA